MEQFIEFFVSLWNDWLDQSPINKVAIAASFIVPSLGWLWTVLRVRDKANRIRRLERETEALRQERNLARAEADNERAFADLWMPERWLEKANRHRAEGNDQKAIDTLNIGMDNVSEKLAEVATEIAGHRLGLMVEDGQTDALASAERFANLAALLDPGQDEAAELLSEIGFMKAETGGEDKQGSGSSPLPFPASGDDQVLNAIITRGRSLFQQGHYRIARRLFSRGVTLVKSSGGFDSPIGLRVRYEEALAMGFAGHAKGALEKIRELLPVEERVQGAEHPDVLSTRYLEALLMNDTGDAKGALEKIRELLPVEERVQGAEHPRVLTTRSLEALLMNDTGDAKGALERIRELLPVRERVQGAEHPGVLRTRWLHGEILASLAETDTALSEWRAILPPLEAKLLPTHRYIVDTKASIAKYGDTP